MEAPDKIYVPQHIIEARNIQELGKPIVAGSTEYIRKDALLDKLNLALKLRTSDNPDINTDGVQTIKAMINYIESL